MSFERMPDDVVLEILVLLAQCDRKVLRLVSKRLSKLVAPSLFSSLKSFASRLEVCEKLRSDISSGATAFLEHTLEFEIVVYPTSSEKKHLRSWFDLWFILLPMMRNLSSLTWAFTPDWCPADCIDTLIRAIGAHENIVHLDLEIAAGNTPLSLQPLSHLRILSVVWIDGRSTPWPGFATEVSDLLERCPNLESLKLGSEMPWSMNGEALKCEPFGDCVEGWFSLKTPLELRSLLLLRLCIHCDHFLAHIRHLKKLENLTLGYDLNPSHPLVLKEIFAAFRTERIHLKQISICSIHPSEIIDYISSYSGLEDFSLDSYDVEDDSPTVVLRFLEALKHHHTNLRRLQIIIDRVSSWGKHITRHILENAELYRSLQEVTIRVCLTPEDVEDNRFKPLASWLNAAMRLPALCTMVCHPVRYKTGIGRMSLSGGRHDSLLPQDELEAQHFESILKNTITEFIREHNPPFSIHSRAWA